ncbi:MAG: CDP-alcohol phosphatidyltransferase family protein [Oscillospiraceae bacterium]|nr:CDP-alcohol phosphatidyltransferase family protein [Oscillospiraceae bacterium]
MKDWKKDILTVPNLLSLFRLLLIPVYIMIYLNADSNSDYYIAAGILAVSCLTDLIDGKIARHFNMISNVGKILDPLADKATQFALILCLTMKYPVLLILVGLFIVKESFQLIQGFIILRKGQILSGALLSGKISTTVLFVSLIFMVMFPDIDMRVIYILTGIDCVFLLISFIGYARIYFTHSPMIQTIEKADPPADSNP